MLGVLNAGEKIVLLKVARESGKLEPRLVYAQVMHGGGGGKGQRTLPACISPPGCPPQAERPGSRA